MKPCWPRQLLSIILLFSFACATLGTAAPETPAAILRASGKVQVNGSDSRKVTTLFSGDSVQTGDDSVANIVAGGSSVLVMPNASVKFLGNAVELTQGGMAIATSVGMSAMADGVTVTPAAKKLSKFEVAETEDSVVVAAQQGNVAVSDGQQTSTTQEGQETTHKKKKKEGGAASAASGSHAVSGKYVALVAGALGAFTAGVVIIETSNNNKKCISSNKDKKCKCKKDKNGREDCEED
jgi:hypothetical protein